MKTCLDVDYRDGGAHAAAVTFQDWPDAAPVEEKAVRIAAVAPYVAGEFFRRELPCLLAALETLAPPETVIIDGYVWLDDDARRPGLGAHLYEALHRRVAVIGVAKTRFRDARSAREVLRGASARPLFVSAAGVDADHAAHCIGSMHGEHRIPTLIARVDRLCRRDTPGIPAVR